MSSSGGSRTEQAIDLRYEGRFEEAIALLRKAVEFGEEEALRELAYALLGSPKPREAVRVVKKAVKHGRTDLYSLLVSIASDVGDAKTAGEAYRAAIEFPTPMSGSRGTRPSAAPRAGVSSSKSPEG